MPRRIKEVDGGREATIEAHSGSVFFEGHGFAYEFDENIFLNAVARAVSHRDDMQAAIMYPPRRAFETEEMAPSPRAIALFA